ncbi:MAG: DEAD/DEAH box helicase, partial [Candidatus Tectomicrobia bacterium]|nr:DEAD/DEAH box helicase [Candidatus Tectomicrobia bacterium]
MPIMNHSQTLAQVLQQTFGFDDFRPGQREVVDNLLADRSAAAVFPTGG